MKSSKATSFVGLFLAGLLCFGSLTGCTGGQKGLGIGGGVGALMGNAIGGDTDSTLIGAAVGAGVGYVIGNERDKRKAKKEAEAMAYIPPSSALTGSSWMVVSVNPKSKQDFRAMAIEFRADGYVETTKTLKSGQVVVRHERYRVVDDVLVVYKKDYIINARYRIDGKNLILKCETFSAVLIRVG